ncbi:MAG: thioesterase family protein [Bacteroidales bacterium]
MSKNMSFNHSTPIQLRFNDVDVIGHVNNSVYQNYFDIARMRYFEEVFGDRLDWHDQLLVLVKIEIEFLQAVDMYDEIFVLTKVNGLGNKSLHMEQRLTGPQSSDIRCINRAILSGYDYKKKDSIPLPNQWREAIKNFEQDVDFDS